MDQQKKQNKKKQQQHVQAPPQHHQQKQHLANVNKNASAASTNSSKNTPVGRGDFAQNSKKQQQQRQKVAVKQNDDDSSESDDIDSDDTGSSSGTESDDLDMTKIGAKASAKNKSMFDDEEEDDKDSSDDDDDEDDEDEDDDENDESPLVQVDFNFLVPSEIDYKSIRRLLVKYLPGEEDTFDSSALADAIIAQTSLGTVVKVGEEDLDVYSFSTILPIQQHKETTWMKSIRSYILKKCNNNKNDAMRARFARAFDEENVGLYINERIINVPPELAPPLQQSLANDLASLQSKSSSSSSSSSSATSGGAYQFSHFLMIAPCWTERATPEAIAARAAKLEDAKLIAKRFVAGGGGKGGRNNTSESAQQKGAGASSSSSSATFVDSDSSNNSNTLWNYYHFEDEILAGEAEASFSFNVASDDSNIGLAPSSASSGGGEGGAGGSQKRRRNQDNEDDDQEDGNNGADENKKALRAPQARKVLLIPASALSRAVEITKSYLAFAESAAPSALSSVAAAATMFTASSGAAQSHGLKNGGGGSASASGKGVQLAKFGNNNWGNNKQSKKGKKGK